ncbi:Predicted PurR-regulated permease PerM [Ruminococcus sp. YRD2003]|uniref:AI-2E family transporter n=1 Tax=Ruminococcus sp. YRD2003 TaxID=1452313 RepID=UPI0008D84E9C|nr:Predicted PurR-regulated permease PerM [Ruminococcus flavefaciens]
MDRKYLKRYIIIAVIAIISCFIIKNFSFFGKILSLGAKSLYPLALGAVIAYIINIIMRWYETKYFPKSEKKFVKVTRRPVCLVLSLLSAAAILALVLNIIIPEIINAVKLITTKVPPLYNDCKVFILKKLSEYPELQHQANEIFNEFDVKELDWTSVTENVSYFVQHGVIGIISSAVGLVSTVAGYVTNYIIAFIFAIYLLLRKDKILSDINRIQAAYFSEKFNRIINHVCKTGHECFRNFFVGQFIEAIILGSLCFIGMTVLKLPYAAMSGTLVGVTALIPIVGAFIGAGFSAFIIMTENPMQAVIFLIFLIILQQFEGNIIYPKVVGDSIGLPGIWVLAAVTVGGGLFGIVGMLVGVPLAATVYKLSFDVLEAREKRLGIASPARENEKKPKDKEKRTKKKEKQLVRSEKSTTNKKES